MMIISSVRYALGRSSYIVGSTIDFVKAMKNPSEKFIAVLKRDISEQLERYPDTTYANEWKELQDYFN